MERLQNACRGALVGVYCADSDQTALLAKHLIENNGFDPDTFRAYLRWNILEGRSLLWDGQSTGAGESTIVAVGDDKEKADEVINNAIGSNGSLMCSAPMALWVASRLFAIDDQHQFSKENRQWAQELVYRMSAVTHAHPHAKEACWIYTIILSSLLAGNDKNQAVDDVYVIDNNLKVSELWIRVQSRLRDPHDFPYDPGAWPARGTAEFSLYVALYAFRQAESFEHGIELAVKVGGDTDTYAAIAGGLLGAYYGYEAIPQEWRDTILGHDQMVAYADQLYKLRFAT